MQPEPRILPNLNGQSFFKNPDTVEPFNFELIRETALIDLTKPVKKPAIAIQIDGTDVLSFGNIGTLIGKAKAKKTFFVSQIIASCIGGKWGDKISANITSDKNIVAFMDTEQAHWHVQKFHKRINRLLGKQTDVNIPKFQAFKLREYSTKERLQFIEEYIHSTQDLAVLIIDGIRDLITSINDEEQATEIVGKLMRWSEKRGIAILAVLHMNKGDNNARGHIGTELMNKSECVISIEKDAHAPDRSIVSSLYQRDKEFPDFAFKINDSGLPEIESDWKPAQKNAKKTSKPTDCPIEKHIEILGTLKKVLLPEENPTYSVVLAHLKYAINDKWKKVGDNLTKEYLTHYKNEGYISKVGEGKNVHYSVV